MRLNVLSAALACLAMTALPASAAYTATSGLKVQQITADSFEVFEGQASGGTHMWCAAGEYAMDIGRTAPKQRMWVQTPRTGDRKSVVFSFTPDAGMPTAQSTINLAVGQRGANFSVQHAKSVCSNLTDPIDFF